MRDMTLETRNFLERSDRIRIRVHFLPFTRPQVFLLMLGYLDDDENFLPQNAGLYGAKPAGEFIKSPETIVNARTRRMSSRHMDPLEYSEVTEENESMGMGESSVVVPSASLDRKDPEWNDTAPIQLVRHFEGKFEMTSEAQSYFSSIVQDRRVVVVSVCGSFRTGKSYLLNLLSGRIGPTCERSRSLFETSGTVGACTSGIWMWGSTPRSANEPVYLLVDCEGSGNSANNRDHDSRLFAIAMLMSSYFMYNSKGVIDDPSLSALSLVASLAASSIDASITQKSKPKFMWVLRDFVLALESLAGTQISSSEYLDNLLRSKPAYRRSLSQLFVTLDCTTLVAPVTDESFLQRLTEISWGELRPEFRSQVLSLRSKLLRDAKPKKSFSDDTEMTGLQYMQFLQAVVSAINSGTVPRIDSIWKEVQAAQTEALVTRLTKEFESRIAAITLPTSEDELDHFLTGLRKELLRKFKTIAGDENEARNDLVFNLLSLAKRVGERNAGKSQDRSEQLLRHLWREEVVAVLKNASKSDVSEQLVRERISVLKSKFFAQAVGPKEIIGKTYNDNILPRFEKLLAEFKGSPMNTSLGVSSIHSAIPAYPPPTPVKAPNKCLGFFRCFLS